MQNLLMILKQAYIKQAYMKDYSYSFFRAERTITQTTNTTHLHPYNVHSQKYLSFGNDAVSVKSHLRAQQVALWNDLVPKYKRAGTDKPCDWVAIGLSILTAALAICFVIITVYCCTKNNQRTLPIKNHNQST